VLRILHRLERVRLGAVPAEERIEQPL
jgi:hypothetical protein